MKFYALFLMIAATFSTANAAAHVHTCQYNLNGFEQDFEVKERIYFAAYECFQSIQTYFKIDPAKKINCTYKVSGYLMNGKEDAPRDSETFSEMLTFNQCKEQIEYHLEAWFDVGGTRVWVDHLTFKTTVPLLGSKETKGLSMLVARQN